MSAVTRMVTRRNFSLLSSMRHAARQMEAHPFQRLPNTKVQAPDYAGMVRRLGKQFIV